MIYVRSYFIFYKTSAFFYKKKNIMTLALALARKQKVILTGA